MALGRTAAGSRAGDGSAWLVHHRANLGLRELYILEPVRGARHATACHNLDRMRTSPQLVAARSSARIHTINHAADAAAGRRSRAAAAAALLPGPPEIAVAACLREGVTTEQQTRADAEQPLVRRARHAIVGPARIPYRGKSAQREADSQTAERAQPAGGGLSEAAAGLPARLGIAHPRLAAARSSAMAATATYEGGRRA